MAAEQGPAPSFSVVRRGYDPDQVYAHLARADAATTVLNTDRDAAVEQAGRLTHQLELCHGELEAARGEADRLRAELRALTGPADTVEAMSARMQTLLRLAQDEAGGIRSTAAVRAAEHHVALLQGLQAEAGELSGAQLDEVDLAGPRDGAELERNRQAAAAERARLDEEAQARRAEADRQARQAIELHCRDAVAQVALMHAAATRTARQVLDDADARAQQVLQGARDAVRQTVGEGRREVDGLQELHRQLADQLDHSRQLLDQAIPAKRGGAVAGGVAATGAPDRTITEATLADAAVRPEGGNAEPQADAVTRPSAASSDTEASTPAGTDTVAAAEPATTWLAQPPPLTTDPDVPWASTAAAAAAPGTAWQAPSQVWASTEAAPTASTDTVDVPAPSAVPEYELRPTAPQQP